MCEVQGNSSTAKPNVTFEQVVEQIENLEEPFRKGERTLKQLEAELYQISLSPSDRKRIKAYLKCKAIENDTDIKKWIPELILSVLTILATIIGSAVTVKSSSAGVVYAVAIFVIMAVVCCRIGKKYEIPVRIATNKRRFYEICLNILE